MSHGGPFVGREHEIALIRRAAERVRDRRPQFVYIEGLPGSGKTALLEKALAPYEEWRHIRVDFDEGVQGTPWAGLKRVFGPKYALGDTEEDFADLASRILSWGQLQEKPMVVSLRGFQHVDEETANAYLEKLESTHNAPVLQVFESSLTRRAPAQRVAHAARVSPHGIYINLEPLSVRETGELIADYVLTPIGDEVAQRIHAETAGYPYLVHAVGGALSQMPLGRRNVATALEHVAAGDHTSRLSREVEVLLAETTDNCAAGALHLLAASREPLTRSQLEQAQGQKSDLNEILETGLVSWSEAFFGYRIKNVPVARAVLAGLTDERISRLHCSLASVVEGSEELFHRVCAQKLIPDQEETDAVVRELFCDGQKAISRGDIERGFEWFLAACQLSPTEEALEALAQTSVPIGRPDALVEFKETFAALPGSPLRQAGLALIALQTGDVESAVEAVQQQGRVEPGMPGALIYAQAVADTSMNCAMRGLLGRANAARMRTLVMLTVYREQLLNDKAEKPMAFGAMSDEWHLGYVESIRSAIDLWQMFEYKDSAQMVQAIEDISVALERIEQLPYTDYVGLSLRAARGTRLRQLGDPEAAYRELKVVADGDHSNGFLLHAQAQLALLMFSAGYWDEAHETARKAAGRVLLRGEDASTLIVYAVATLVPVLRGEGEREERLLAELSEIKAENGPLLGGIVDWVKACRSVAARDDEVAAQRLLQMQEEYGGWWTLGIEPIILFSRCLRRTGWFSMLSRLKSSVATGEVPALDEVRQAVLVYIEGIEAWLSGEAGKAMDLLAISMENYEAWPEFFPDQDETPGGSFRLYRALLSLEMACLVQEFPEELAECRSAVLSYVQLGLEVFRHCGASELLNEAVEATSWLRGERAEPPRQSALKEDSGQPRPGTEQGRDEGQTASLEGLTERQRDVAILASQGRTNREVAEILGVSSRTVDYHMSHVLSKLKLRARHQLRHFDFGEGEASSSAGRE